MKEQLIVIGLVAINSVWWSFVYTHAFTNTAWEDELRQEAVSQNIAHWNANASCIVANDDMESDLMDYIKSHEYDCQ
tara:strand:- start:1467 stop:1697 length:231 start_codon:yes stop_codon:yes gene_type:complete